MSDMNGKTEKIRTPRSESKTAKAAEIFTSMPGAARKEVISRFEGELRLTSKGASTYYQTCRKNAGMVHGGGRNTPSA